VRECLRYSTISNPCYCKNPVPTTSVNYPCGGPCPAGCATTSYFYATTTSGCNEETPTATATVTRTIQQCPTVTSTVSRCSTCKVPKCLRLSTLSLDCHCPASIPTVYKSFPCSGECPGGCAGTSYIYETQTSAYLTTPTASPSASPTAEGECVPTVTISAYPTTGCAFNCTTGGFCVLDSKWMWPTLRRMSRNF
jgi:hypothetical protein